MSDQAHEWTDEQIANLSAKIRETYEQAAKEMEGKLESWLKDYESKRSEWEQRVKDGAATQEEFRDWLSGQATYRAWQQAMIDELANGAVNADVMCRQLINDELPRIFAENANYGAYDVDTKLGYDTGFTLADRDTVMRLIKDNPELLPAPRVDIPKDTRWNRDKFASAVTQGVLQGESVPNLAKRLRTVFEMDKRASIRAARTSFTSAENAGRINSYERAKRLGIRMQQEWLATLDMRTRHTHRLLDGQRVPVGGYFEPDGYGEKYRVRFPADPQGLPEMVWGCRCTLVAAVAGVDTSDAQRWSKLPEGMTYDEWKGAKKEGENGQKEQEGKPTIEELQKNVRDRNKAIDDALSVRSPDTSLERYYRDNVSRHEEALKRYVHAKDYDRDALTAESMRLENEIYELQKQLDTNEWPDRSEWRKVRRRILELSSQANTINQKLFELDEYEGAKRRYDANNAELERFLASTAETRQKYEEAQASLPSLIRARNTAIKALSEAQEFGPMIREKVGDDFVNEMERRISAAEERHPEIAAAFRAFSSQLSIVDGEYMDGAYYNTPYKGIMFNANEDRAGSGWEYPFEVAFHEFGHLIDNMSRYWNAWTSSAEDLTSVIKSDWRKFRDDLGRADGVTRDKNGHAIERLREEKRATDDGIYAYSCVSDIIEGCTRTSCPLGFGHGVSYHRDEGATAREFFAEVCESAMVNEASYEQMRRIFPNAVDMVERMMREMFE